MLLPNCIPVISETAPSREAREHLLRLECPRPDQAPTRLVLAFGLSGPSSVEKGTGVRFELAHSPDGELWSPLEGFWDLPSDDEDDAEHRHTLRDALESFITEPIGDLLPYLRVKVTPLGRLASTGMAAARAPELTLRLHLCSDGKVQVK